MNKSSNSKGIEAVEGIAVAANMEGKIYICENEKDIEEAKKIGYCIFPIDNLEEIWTLVNIDNPYAFIRNWRCDILYEEQRA